MRPMVTSNRFASQISAFLVTLAILFHGGCGSPSGSESDIEPIAPDSLVELPVLERDSIEVVEAPILTAEPDTPIVETPDIEASGNESIGFCDVRDTDNRCIDFTGSAWTEGGARTECSNAPGGSFESDSCPGGSRIGSCIVHPNGDATLEMVQSFYEPMNPILAEGICPGVFEAE